MKTTVIAAIYLSLFATGALADTLTLTVSEGYQECLSPTDSRACLTVVLERIDVPVELTPTPQQPGRWSGAWDKPDHNLFGKKIHERIDVSKTQNSNGKPQMAFTLKLAEASLFDQTVETYIDWEPGATVVMFGSPIEVAPGSLPNGGSWLKPAFALIGVK